MTLPARGSTDTIVAHRVAKTFPPRKTGRVRTDELTVLTEFELAIPDGELLALLGPSGCGKSTFPSTSSCRAGDRSPTARCSWAVSR